MSYINKLTYNYQQFQFISTLIKKYSIVLSKMLRDLDKSNMLKVKDIHCKVEEDGSISGPDKVEDEPSPLNHLYIFTVLVLILI